MDSCVYADVTAMSFHSIIDISCLWVFLTKTLSFGRFEFIQCNVEWLLLFVLDSFALDLEKLKRINTAISQLARPKVL